MVILDSVELEKTMSHHDLFLLWSKAFENVGIPIYIVFPDDVMKLKKFYRFYNTDIHYISDVDLIERLDCVQEKVVFGKKYRVILPKMYVVHDKKLVNEQKRINNKMIKKLYIRALELKFENFIKKIKNYAEKSGITFNFVRYASKDSLNAHYQQIDDNTHKITTKTFVS